MAKGDVFSEVSKIEKPIFNHVGILAEDSKKTVEELKKLPYMC